MRTVVEIADGVRRGDIKASDVMQEVRSAVERRDGQLNSFWVLDWASATSAAEEIDRRVAKGDDPGPLAGVPFGVKDVNDCAGFPTSFGSIFFKGGPPKTKDEPAIAKARAAGAIPIGKTATAEFGFDPATRTKAWGVTRNPWNTERTPGGSSGGSAAAVAAGLVPFAWGGDGGGSIRLPAAYTGTVGLKPNHGRIAKPAGGDFTDHAVLTTTARDSARLLDVVSGPAPTDKNSLEPARARYEAATETLDARGLRVVWTEDLGGYVRCDPEVARVARAAAEALAEAGGLTLIEAKISLSVHPVKAWRALASMMMLATALRAGIWPDPIKVAQLTDGPREYLEYGARLSGSDYANALNARATVEAEFAEIFTTYDLLMSPTAPYVAFPAAGTVPTIVDDSELEPGYSTLSLNNFTSWANVTYRPAISIPAGLSGDGLPIGLQIGARHHREDVLLRLARIMEQARPWPRLAPMAAVKA